MSENHPGETELARFEEGSDSGQLVKHLRWCARCRSIVADYRWLGEEIGVTLSAAAEAVPVPRPRWRDVQDRLLAGERQQARRLRVPAVASIVLVFSLMLSISPMVGTAVAARTLPPDAIVAPVPFITGMTASPAVPLATPTPAIPGDEATPPLTPACVLPPTPPEQVAE